MPCAQLFSPRQKAQLDVYGVWGVLRGQLLTDDSFVFNRVLTRLKASVANLAPAEEADEAALGAAKASSEALQKRAEWFGNFTARVSALLQQRMLVLVWAQAIGIPVTRARQTRLLCKQA